MKTCAMMIAACALAGAVSTSAGAAIAIASFAVTAYVPFSISVPQNAEDWLQTGWKAPYATANGAGPQMTLSYVRPGLDRMTITF